MNMSRRSVSLALSTVAETRAAIRSARAVPVASQSESTGTVSTTGRSWQRAASEYGACMAQDVPRVRLAAVGRASLFVVRGDELDPAILRADATRFFRRYQAWGRYGVSAFEANDDLEVDVVCETKLERFPEVAVIERIELESRGIMIVPTFRGPHVTLAHEDIGTLVDQLGACEHRTISNPHHQKEGRWR